MTIDQMLVHNDETSSAILKRDQAYAALYQEIIRLKLEPGTMLDEMALGQRLGFGRTPLREAFQRLATEGLVTIYPRRAIVVTPISLVDVQQQTQARLLWEPNVVRLAAEVGTPDDWDKLAETLKETPTSITTEDDVMRASEANRHFHMGLAAATGNRYVVEMANWHYSTRVRLAFLYFRYGVYTPVHDQHHTILACMRKRDGEGAAKLIEAHIKLTQSREGRLLS